MAFNYFTALTVFLVLMQGAFGFNASTYTASKELIAGKYTVHWRVADDQIFLALRVNTTGWVGFGIAEPTSGSMPGADVVIGYVIRGQGSVEDRYTTGFVTPHLDDCPDWKLVAASEVLGLTTIEVSRALNSSDPQDRTIKSGPNRVIAAYGLSDDFGFHQDMTTSEIVFFGAQSVFDISLPANVKTLELRMPNFTVPNEETVYACHSFAVPIDKNYHIIRVDPLVDPRNVDHVHHYLAHQCSNTGPTSYAQTYQTVAQCFSPIGNPDSGCVGLVSAWAAGGGPTYVPPEAGFPMGPQDTSLQILVLEMHYNNKGGVAGFQDASGLKIYYTETLRANDAAMITLGDPTLNLPNIPANSAPEFETECPSICTQGLGQQEMNVFGSFQHMHHYGTEIWTNHWRDGKLIDTITRIEYWAYDHQQTEPVQFVIKAGDRLNTHCVYDNLDSPTAVEFGVASYQEMCMHFISYYPRILTARKTPYAYCGTLGENYTICGDVDGSSIRAYHQPTIADPPGGRNRTFGVPPTSCPLLPASTTGSASTTATASATTAAASTAAASTATTAAASSSSSTIGRGEVGTSGARSAFSLSALVLATAITVAMM